MLSILNSMKVCRQFSLRNFTSLTNTLLDNKASYSNVENLDDSKDGKDEKKLMNDITTNTKPNRRNQRRKNVKKLSKKNLKNDEKLGYQEKDIEKSAYATEEKTEVKTSNLKVTHSPAEKFDIDSLKEKLESNNEQSGISRLMRALIDDTKTTSENTEEKLKSLMSVKHKKLSVVQGDATNLFAGINMDSQMAEEYGTYLSEVEWNENLKQLLPENIPQNSFDVMMLSIDKQWKFPIDNEQDMGEEEHVSFEEHVFLDHFLDEFPEGRIRNFMELVITGLQQNPYLSLTEKKKRITWFQEYFQKFDAKDLL